VKLSDENNGIGGIRNKQPIMFIKRGWIRGIKVDWSLVFTVFRKSEGTKLKLLVNHPPPQTAASATTGDLNPPISSFNSRPSRIIPGDAGLLNIHIERCGRLN
jgi:hypothetical protein